MATSTKRRTKTRAQTKDFNKGKSHAIGVLGQQYTDGYHRGFDDGWNAGVERAWSMRVDQVGRRWLDRAIRRVYFDKRLRGQRLHLMEDARYWDDEILWMRHDRAALKRKSSVTKFWATFVDGRTVGW